MENTGKHMENIEKTHGAHRENKWSPQGKHREHTEKHRDYTILPKLHFIDRLASGK